MFGVFFLSFLLCDFILFPRHRRCEIHFHFACFYIFRMQYVTGKYKYEIFAHHRETITPISTTDSIIIVCRRKGVPRCSSIESIHCNSVLCMYTNLQQALDKQCIPYLNCCEFWVSVQWMMTIGNLCFS